MDTFFHRTRYMFLSVFVTAGIISGSVNAADWKPSGSNIFYNDGRVGVGNNNPLSTLHINDSNFPSFRMEANNDTPWKAPFYASRKSRGTNASPSSIAEGDTLGVFDFWGYGGGWGRGASISAIIDAAPSGTVIPTSLRFITTKSDGSTSPRLIVKHDGKVGIGTLSPDAELAVNGTIKGKEVIVTSTGWADYVFKDNYKLKSIEEIDAFITQNGHLPGVPTQDDVNEKGIPVGDMTRILLEKVEELTLHVISLKKENIALAKRLEKVSVLK